jgi:hypothetical protein
MNRGHQVCSSALAASISIAVGLTLSACAPEGPEDWRGVEAPADAAGAGVLRVPLAAPGAGELGGDLDYIQRIDLVAPLSPSSVVPPVPPDNPEATASGTGTLRLQLKRNSPGAPPTSAVAGLIFSLCGLPGTSVTITGADVRQGGPGETSAEPFILGTVTAPVTFPLTGGCLKEGFGGGAPPGESLGMRAMQVIQDPQNHYFELRTETNPDGAVRGQLDYASAI